MQKKKGSKIMPKVFKRVLLLLTVASLLLISLCGCAGDTDNNKKDPSSAESDELSAGSSVTVGIAQDLDSLDPHRAVNAGTSEVMFNIFEGLMKASPDGGVIPAVASDYEISPDGKTYTFTLREGVTFHNGNAVTLEDVLYSLKRCAGSESEGTPLIAAFSNVADVSADDQGRVVITLAEPSLEFLNAATAAIIKGGLVWGCDACQLACPHNRAVIEDGRDTPVPYFRKDRLIRADAEALAAMDDAAFNARAYSWRGRAVIERNIRLFDDESFMKRR